MHRISSPDPHQDRPRVAVILAAGVGARLGAVLARGAPKCLLPIAGRSLLARQVDALAQAGVERVVLVVGHEEGRVRAEAQALAERHGVAFDFVRNERYGETNTIYSQYLAREHLSSEGGCFCLNGDVLFPPSVLSRLAQAPRGEEAALAIDVRRCGDEEVKVTADQGGRIRDIGKGLDPSRCLGEFIGVARYGAAAGAAFAEALTQAVEREGRTRDYFELALSQLAARVPLLALPLHGEPVIEIDFPEDYRRAVDEVLPRIATAGGEHGRLAR